MPEVSKDVIHLLSFLLPGFLLAWVFYSLTSHPKPAQFERIVQALIFTLIVKTVVVLEQKLLLYLGGYISLGRWDKDAELLSSVTVAVLLGYFGALLVNKDTVYAYLRRKGVSTRSSHASEWITVLSDEPKYVVLNLKNGRRLYGWPKVWPSDSKKGHFYITHAIWLIDGNEENKESSAEVDGILVSANEVEFIEFVRKPKEALK